jgi:hypothetical protein
VRIVCVGSAGERRVLSCDWLRMMRRHLRLIVVIWLAGQTGVLAAAPVLFATGFTPAAAAQVCTCATLGPGHFCPMHGSGPHHSSTGEPPERDAAECVLRSGIPGAGDTISSLLAGAGLVPHVHALFAAFRASEPVRTVLGLTVSRFARPELPPPRLYSATQRVS